MRKMYMKNCYFCGAPVAPNIVIVVDKEGRSRRDVCDSCYETHPNVVGVDWEDDIPSDFEKDCIALPY